MKHHKPSDKLAKKKQVWVERTARILAISEDEAAQLLATPRHQSIRMNPLRGNPQEIMGQLGAIGWEGQPYPWLEHGYSVTGDMSRLRDSELVQDGQVYIQNAASWLPVLALDPQPGETILDVCAAPGGKTSHIAAITGNQARITANDNSRPRLAKLQANLARLGADIERFTLFDATMLVRKFDGEQFDRILIDAPCSGEGLMDITNDKDFASWSVAHIKRLQQLQKRVISQAWQLLAPGGTLVYSTCTMAPEENEAVIDYLLRTHEEARLTPLDITLPNRIAALAAWNGRTYRPELQGCIRLKPSTDIEAFFVCKLRKI